MYGMSIRKLIVPGELDEPLLHRFLFDPFTELAVDDGSLLCVPRRGLATLTVFLGSLDCAVAQCESLI